MTCATLCALGFDPCTVADAAEPARTDADPAGTLRGAVLTLAVAATAAFSAAVLVAAPPPAADAVRAALPAAH